MRYTCEQCKVKKCMETVVKGDIISYHGPLLGEKMSYRVIICSMLVTSLSISCVWFTGVIPAQ